MHATVGIQCAGLSRVFPQVFPQDGGLGYVRIGVDAKNNSDMVDNLPYFGGG